MYEINKIENNVQIRISNPDDSVKKALDDCKEGRCSCKTSEYKKLKELNINSDTKDALVFELIPKENEILNVAEIENCLKTIA